MSAVELQTLFNLLWPPAAFVVTLLGWQALKAWLERGRRNDGHKTAAE